VSAGWGRASGGFRDPMIRPLREAELEPVRVVVELSREQFQSLDRRSRRLGVPAFLAGSVAE